MAYGGRAKRATRMRTTRIARVTATQKTARAAKQRAARAKPKAVRGNARGVAANARAIGLLKKQLYGPVQKQITQFRQMVTRDCDEDAPVDLPSQQLGAHNGRP